MFILYCICLSAHVCLCLYPVQFLFYDKMQQQQIISNFELWVALMSMHHDISYCYGYLHV